MANKDSTSNTTIQKASKVVPATPKARSRRKSKSISVATNLLGNTLFIDPERRKAKELERWKAELLEYRASLSKDDLKIFNKTLSFLVENPEIKERLKGCPVIPFPAIRK